MSKMGKMTGLLGVCILSFLHMLHWRERPESRSKCDGVYDNRAAITKHCRKTAHWCNYMWQVAVSRLSGCLIKTLTVAERGAFLLQVKKVCTSLAPVYPVLILMITPISTRWGAAGQEWLLWGSASVDEREQSHWLTGQDAVLAEETPEASWKSYVYTHSDQLGGCQSLLNTHTLTRSFTRSPPHVSLTFSIWISTHSSTCGSATHPGVQAERRRERKRKRLVWHYKSLHTLAWRSQSL